MPCLDSSDSNSVWRFKISAGDTLAKGFGALPVEGFGALPVVGLLSADTLFELGPAPILLADFTGGFFSNFFKEG